ncbi:hypothetical protein SLA2020_265000 [Shorea laevis]
MRGSEQNLECPVLDSDDLVGVALERNGEGAVEAQIDDLENAVGLSAPAEPESSPLHSYPMVQTRWRI